ncbi:uncharacterized protein LOC129918166 [Episyrphus balteatus]|uniref:uncharacterized protein LOC129918166 n=1 Tax=Episyrphus balteatus TaxID=286459 RepID=UPI002485730E|nr:uncharacterized protein LOC129918166 [Episyrphus balteatus]
MRDLHGLTLPVDCRGSKPAIIVSEDTNDEKIIGGFVGNIIKAFAKRHNAKLNTSNARDVITPISMYKLVLNGTVEIPCSDMLILQNSNIWFSYPFTQLAWGVIVPVEDHIPIYKIFAFIFYWKAFAVTVLVLILLSILTEVSAFRRGSQRAFVIRDLFFNIDCFCGILGQTFSEEPNASFTTKIIYLLIFLLGIMIVTSYNAFLQSFMTEPPGGKIIKSFDDFKSFNLKIYTTDINIQLMRQLRPTIMEKYSNLFISEKNFETYTRILNNLDTKYAYTLPEYKWEVYKNEQNFYGRQLFRWSDDLVLLKNVLAAISINENSIYRNALSFHILEIQSSGLMNYWRKKTFYELLSFRKITKLNLGFDSRVKALIVEDLKWILISLGLAYVVTVACFLGEICIYKWKN